MDVFRIFHTTGADSSGMELLVIEVDRQCQIVAINLEFNYLEKRFTICL